MKRTAGGDWSTTANFGRWLDGGGTQANSATFSKNYFLLKASTVFYTRPVKKNILTLFIKYTFLKDMNSTSKKKKINKN